MGKRLMSEFKGLVAAVTGAGSGIGLATAKMLADGGAKVYGLDIAEGGLAGVAEWLPCDVSDDASVSAAFSKMSQLDILINSAAISSVGNVEANSSDEWHKVMNINVVGIVRTSRYALPLLRKSKCPSIVNVCSVAATAGIPKRALYSATKGAVLSLTMAMANDYVSEGIRVNCVNPGTADTPWVQRLLRKLQIQQQSARRLKLANHWVDLSSADEVARALCYLASPLQGSTTATSLSRRRRYARSSNSSIGISFHGCN
jgi:NAD(P)-dependent dehydrogenase (short-subunit alcohol dehydrogenase family)